jgi:hypothetical protein
MSNPTLGVVGQADLINATGLPIASGVAGLGAGIATFLGTPSSANLRTAVTDETGSGSLVFANAPVLVAPNLGTPTFLVATNATGTAVGLTAGSAITNANLTGAVTSVGNATSLGSFTSAQLRTALTDETGAGSAVFATSPTITAPILNQINDTNNAQILGLSPTTSAVDYLVVKNGIGVGVPLHFYADGASANIGLHIQPKGTGLVTISDGTDFNKGIRFRSSGSAASAITLLDAVSTAGRVVTLPDATTTLVGRDTTDTLTNKTIAFSSNTFSGTLAIANGGTNASTAASAIENLLPAYTGNGSKGLRLNSGATALEWVADGGGTVTSVGGTGTVNGITLTGTVTTSGNLTLGGTLSGVSLTSQVTGTLPTANGGTNLTSFTSGGVVYASSSSALATGSALQFDGTGTLTIGGAGSRLTVQSTTGTNNSLIKFSNTGGDAYIGLDNSGGGLGAAYALQLYHEGNYPIVFSTNNTERMRLTSSSLYTASGINVGIGTSSPSQKLTVSGGIASVAGISALTASSAFFDYNSGNGRFAAVGSTTGTAAPITFSQYSSNGSVGRDAVTIDSSGNVGIGTSNPTSANGSDRFLVIAGSASANVASLVLDPYTGNAHEFQSYNGALKIFNGTTQQMTLDSSGNLLVGTTSVSLVSSASVSAGVFYGTQASATTVCFQAWNQATSGDNKFVEFYTEGGGGTLRGSITYNRAGGLTAYNVTSDYRAKDISGPVTNSGALIDSTPVYMGTMKGATQERPMFIAHEVPAYAHTGEKDAVDADGNPVYQQMDASALIPVMWAEIQSLRQRLSAANL